MENVDGIKSWLDKMDILFFESTKNFAWATLLTEIRKDIPAFVEDGGWNIILNDSSEDEEDALD